MEALWCLRGDHRCSGGVLAHTVQFAGFAEPVNHRAEDDCPEWEFGPQVAALLHFGVEAQLRQLAPDEILLIYKTANKKTSVQIQKNLDALTTADIAANWPLVEAAIREEVRSFYDMQTFERALRTSCNNVCTCRWVLRWKLIDGVRTVKARLTIRGFEDLAQDIPTYASTCTRWGQRLVCSVAIQHGWSLFSADVGVAFLRGLTFKELSQLTGQPERDVAFMPPANSEVYFRELPGLSNLNFQTEVLRLLKPAYGLKDAPKAWRLRLDQALRELDLHPVHTDGSIYTKHNDNRLVLIISTHVDDIKGAGVEAEFKLLISGLTKAFGDLKISHKNFEHCGIKYSQDAEKIVMSQHHYALQLRPIDTSTLDVKDLNRVLNVQELSSYQSLLGGLSWLIQTRTDVAIYVCALQRASSKATFGHLLKLNKVVKWCRRKDCPLTYVKIPGKSKVMVISDAAFRKETEQGLAMRGAMIGICQFKEDQGNTADCSGIMHLLEFYSRKQRRVTRSTYAAELNALADAYEIGRLVSLTVSSVILGPVPARELLLREEQGKLPLPIHCAIDCFSVFESLSQEDLRMPSEASLILILHGLKEALLCHNLRELFWIATEDMLSDGLNKGAVSREALIRFGLTGKWSLSKPCKRHYEFRHVPVTGSASASRDHVNSISLGLIDKLMLVIHSFWASMT